MCRIGSLSLKAKDMVIGRCAVLCVYLTNYLAMLLYR
jgi:hypothetical protein